MCATIGTLPRKERGIWQRRFWEHTIDDEDDYIHHFDYLLCNPVKHGLVQRVRDYEWSTFHRYVKEGIYPANWAEGQGEIIVPIDVPEPWHRFVKAALMITARNRVTISPVWC